MKKIGFIGAYDKTDFIMYVAKILKLLNNRVLVIDTTILQKSKYIVPTINPTMSYITDFEDIDVAVGFNEMKEINRFIGLHEETKEEDWPYDYILIDIDSNANLEKFDIANADKKYFVTWFDLYSLRKGIEVLENLDRTMEVTKVLFAYDTTKEDEEYLNFLSLECKVKWNEYTIYFPITEEDDKVIKENQRVASLKHRRLSAGYKESLAYIVQDIVEEKHVSKILRIVKE